LINGTGTGDSSNLPCVARERNRIQTPEIAPIELFYFSMYLLITLGAVLLEMLFRDASWRI